MELIADPNNKNHVSYIVKAKSQFKEASIANNVQIIVPVPRDASSPEFRSANGTIFALLF